MGQLVDGSPVVAVEALCGNEDGTMIEGMCPRVMSM